MSRFVPRFAFIALLAIVLSVGQVGALIHGVYHVDSDLALASLADDSQTHGDHSSGKPCNAFDGLIGAAACGAGLNLSAPPQVAPPSAQFYFRNPIALIVFSTRAPLSFPSDPQVLAVVLARA